MAEQKLKFDETTGELTMDSKLKLEEKAAEIVGGLKGADEKLIEELSDMLTNEKDDQLLPLKLQEKLFQSLGIESNLEEQQKIKKELAFLVGKEIYNALSPADQHLFGSIDFSSSTTFDGKSFNSGLERINDERVKLLLSPIMGALEQEVSSYTKLENESKDPDYRFASSDLSKFKKEASLLKIEINEMPDSAKKHELEKRINEIQENFSKLEQNLSELPEKDTIIQATKNLEKNSDSIFSELKTLVGKLGKKAGWYSTVLSKGDARNIVDKCMQTCDKNDETVNEITSTIKSPPLSSTQKTQIDQNLQNVKASISGFKTSLEDYNTNSIQAPLDFNEAAQKNAADALDKLISEKDPTTGLSRSQEIIQNIKGLISALPEHGQIFKDLESYASFYGLGHSLSQLRKELIGDKASIGDRRSYEGSAIYQKELFAAQKRQGEIEKQDLILKTFENRANAEAAVATDDQLFEKYYRKYLFNPKYITDKAFVANVQAISHELSGLAKVHEIDMGVDILSPDTSIAEKLTEFEKIIAGLGGDHKLNPSLRQEYQKLKESAKNPETNLQKLLEKVKNIEKLKKDLIDAKNLDILDSKIPQFTEDLKKELVELRKLEVEIFGPETAFKVRQEFIAERKRVSKYIILTSDGKAVAKAGSRLYAYLKDLKDEISNAQTELNNLSIQIEQETDPAQKSRLKEEFNLKYRYLSRLEELLEEKKTQMESYVISKPEKRTPNSDAIFDLVQEKEQNRFQNKRLVRDRLFRSVFLSTNPFRYIDMWRESRHTAALMDLFSTELSYMLENGYGPDQQFLSPVRRLINAPFEFLLKKSVAKRQEILSGIRKAQEERSRFFVEHDKKVTTKMKRKYVDLEHEADIWNSSNIQRAIKISRRLQQLYASSSPNTAEVKRLSDELKSLVLECQDANKRLQEMIAPKFGEKTAAEEIKRIREQEEQSNERTEKVTKELYDKIKKAVPDKFYPESANRYKNDFEGWKKLAQYPHLPENIDKGVLEPFFTYLKLHQKNTLYIFKPEDVFILLKMQTTNLLHPDCPFTKSEHFYKDYEYLRKQKKVRTVREYLDFRKSKPHALKT